MREAQVLKPRDVSEIMGIGRDRAYRLFKSNAFPSLRIGNTYFVTAENFQKWLNEYAGKEYKL